MKFINFEPGLSDQHKFTTSKLVKTMTKDYSKKNSTNTIKNLKPR